MSNTTKIDSLEDWQKELLAIAGRYPEEVGDGCGCRVYVWRHADRRRRRVEPMVEFQILEVDEVLALHRGEGLTLEEVLAYDYSEKSPVGDVPPGGWDLAIWRDGRVVAVVEYQDGNGIGTRVIRLDREPAGKPARTVAGTGVALADLVAEAAVRWAAYFAGRSAAEDEGHALSGAAVDAENAAIERMQQLGATGLSDSIEDHVEGFPQRRAIVRVGDRLLGFDDGVVLEISVIDAD